MSAQEIASRLINRVSQQNSKVAHPEALPYLFEGFETDLLMKADDIADRRVTGICARAAVGVARRRAQKMRNTDDQIVLISDFVPAFEYVSELSIPKNRFRFPSEDVAAFTTEVSKLIRDCCPWC